MMVELRPTPRVAALGEAPSECGDIAADVAPSSSLETPVGWASLDDLGQAGTTGGAGGEVALARTIEELTTLVRGDEPRIVLVCGDLGSTGTRVAFGSNKTLIGVGTRPTIRASLEIEDVQNVIVKDVFIRGADPDGISTRRAHHVWIDHVDISDSVDGNLDITDESDYVTVSWTRFWYRSAMQGHRFSNLVGSGDNRPSDVGKLRVTWLNNWWADNVDERMPRVRYGQVHVVNNYYTSSGDNYCIRGGMESSVLAEGNFFQTVSNPFDIDLNGNILERNNIFDRSGGRRSGTGVAFEPPYVIDMVPPEDIPDLVQAGAGPRQY